MEQVSIARVREWLVFDNLIQHSFPHLRPEWP